VVKDEYAFNDLCCTCMNYWFAIRPTNT